MAPPQTASANKAMLAEPRACRKPGDTGGVGYADIPYICDWLVVEKLSHPSEKYKKKSVGMMTFPYMKWKKHQMFQTTNQLTFVKCVCV